MLRARAPINYMKEKKILKKVIPLQSVVSVTQYFFFVVLMTTVVYFSKSLPAVTILQICLKLTYLIIPYYVIFILVYNIDDQTNTKKIIKKKIILLFKYLHKLSVEKDRL